MPKVTAEDVTRAQAHVVGLLNEVEHVLRGWVLGYDAEIVASHTSPLYEMCDTDTPPSMKAKEA